MLLTLLLRRHLLVLQPLPRTTSHNTINMRRQRRQLLLLLLATLPRATRR